MTAATCGGAASAMARSSIMWNEAKSASASSTISKMTLCRTTYWPFRSRSTHWHVSATRCHVPHSVASPVTLKQQCCERSPDAHKSDESFCYPEGMKFGVLVFPGSNCDHDTYNVIEQIAHQ